MKEIFDKLTSYNLFNYLLPGIIFALLAAKLTRFSLIHPDVVIGAFVYYFIGLVISRLGSLVVEPVLKKARFLKYSAYKDFVAASKVDTQIEVLSEANNSYRTLCSTFMLLLLLKFYERASVRYPQITHYDVTVLLVALMLLFLFAWRKQAGYVSKRVAVATAKDPQGKAANA